MFLRGLLHHSILLLGWQSAPALDSGDFAIGRNDFSRYTPLMCVTAARNAAGITQRSVEAQSAALERAKSPARDTLPDDAKRIAQTCGARFNIANTPPASFSDLFTLALITENDSLALAVIQHRLEHTADSAKSQLLLNTLQEVLAERPVREGVAQAIMRQLDATGARAVQERIFGHDALVRYYDGIYDRAGMRRESEQMIALATPRLKGDSAQRLSAYFTIGEGFRFATKALYVDHPDSLAMLASRSAKLFSRVPKSEYPIGGMNETQFRQWLIPPEITNNPTPIGDSTPSTYPSFSADYWFPKRPDASSAKRATIYVNTVAMWSLGWQEGCLRYQPLILSGAVGCQKLAEEIRRWVDQYGEKDLSVVIVTRTQGYAMFTGPLSPSEEADSIQAYFRKYLKLPVTVAVINSPVERHPDPDGRFVYSDNEIMRNYTEFDTVHEITTIGPHGELLYKGKTGPFFDAMLGTLLKEADSPQVTGTR